LYLLERLVFPLLNDLLVVLEHIFGRKHGSVLGLELLLHILLDFMMPNLVVNWIPLKVAAVGFLSGHDSLRIEIRVGIQSIMHFVQLGLLK